MNSFFGYTVSGGIGFILGYVARPYIEGTVEDIKGKAKAKVSEKASALKNKVFKPKEEEVEEVEEDNSMELSLPELIRQEKVLKALILERAEKSGALSGFDLSDIG